MIALFLVRSVWLLFGRSPTLIFLNKKHQLSLMSFVGRGCGMMLELNLLCHVNNNYCLGSVK
jgi:hypothetical protein